MKKQVKEVYNSLQRRRKFIKIRAFLMAGFLLAINSFAWFVFMTDGRGKITADVISWDIAFFDEDVESEIIDLELTDLYPGMETYKKDIMILNRSDLDAVFECFIEKVTVFGVEYTSDDLLTSLESELPFSIVFGYDGSDIDKGNSLLFNVLVNWPFEAEQDYYKLNSLYTYIEGINYYVLENEEYVITEVNADNFNEKVESGLYIESDDADTYWGEKSINYREEFPDDSVLHLQLKLIVSQKRQ